MTTSSSFDVIARARHGHLLSDQEAVTHYADGSAPDQQQFAQAYIEGVVAYLVEGFPSTGFEATSRQLAHALGPFKGLELAFGLNLFADEMGRQHPGESAYISPPLCGLGGLNTASKLALAKIVAAHDPSPERETVIVDALSNTNRYLHLRAGPPRNLPNELSAQATLHRNREFADHPHLPVAARRSPR